jgi:hypothetical protein
MYDYSMKFHAAQEMQVLLSLQLDRYGALSKLKEKHSMVPMHKSEVHQHELNLAPHT